MPEEVETEAEAEIAEDAGVAEVATEAAIEEDIAEEAREAEEVSGETLGNVWRADRHVTLNYLNKLAEVCPDLVVSTGCTLLHVPYDLLVESDLTADAADAAHLADRLAFAKQKTLESGFAGEGADRGSVGEVAHAAQGGALQAEACGAPTGLRDHCGHARAWTLRVASCRCSGRS